MPETSSRNDPSVVAGASPNLASTTPTPDPQEKRLSSLLDMAWWGKQFAVRLKANARWMKQFLHGDQ